MTASARAEDRLGREGAHESVLTAGAVARLVGGELRGDEATPVRRVAPLDRAERDEVSLLASSAYLSAFEHTTAGVVLVSPALADAPGRCRCRIVVARPYDAMAELLPVLYDIEARPAPGIHPTAVVGAGARLGAAATVGPYAVVGAGARIGDRVRIGAHCSIGAGVEVGADADLGDAVTLVTGTVLGSRVRIHAGSRIGTAGFGYLPAGDGEERGPRRVPHVGRCVVEDDVEIGANSTIDRGSIDDTVIGAGTKIDNLVHIAHNVRIGRGCLIMAQVGIAGSVRVGDGCILAGQVGIGGHRTIGAGARLAGQAGVFGDVPPGETWSGYPARPHKESLRAQAALFRLAGLVRKLERLIAREA